MAYIILRVRFFAMFAISLVMSLMRSSIHHYAKYSKLPTGCLLGILVLLLLTVLTGMGQNTMGATRWIALGPIQLQPSELIKPFLVLQGAKLFGRWEQYPVASQSDMVELYLRSCY